MATKRKFFRQGERNSNISTDFSDDPGLTKQDQKDMCDINKIVRNENNMGFFAHVNNMEAEYGYADSVTFKEAMDLVNKANEQFRNLPSKLRNKFKNDPGSFLDFCNNPDNVDEMRELGLLQKEKGPDMAETLSELAEAVKNLPIQDQGSAGENAT